ncbi:tachykinin-like peptides receptor 99D isoform X2 [Eriocheir sinensis]|uniref:tachykinin-like peptides receptor 99D isoform X2 n=1 Tax=Eriocheir sinensis TaxID=95602 RepID=UPI0021C580F2|nr:tachykinin-like peptides receptor 99D isoform X2 [Eriocheir sinensis]
MHSNTKYVIANLALADIIIGLFSIPFQFQAALLQRWNLPPFMCAFCPFFQTVSVNVSVFTLTAIAVDRYRAIVFPLSARPSKFRSKVVILSIWLFSVTLAVPNAIVPRVIQKMNPRTGELKPVCDMEGMDPVVMRTYSHIMVGLQFFVPLSVISFAYLRMGWQLWGARTPGNAEDARDAHVLRNKKKVIKMLFIVVALFAFCWAPLQSYHILQEIYPDINEYRFINIIWFCCHWLAMSNSCCNPFIYAIYNEKYKREFRRKFRWFFQDETGGEASDCERSRNQMSLRFTRERLGGDNRSFRTEATTLNGSARTGGARPGGRAFLVSPSRPSSCDAPPAPLAAPLVPLPTPRPPQQEVHVCAPLIAPSHLHPPVCRGRGWGDTQI